ncbi:MAG: toll/interleukin-1 receptor domain-containing protein, partial [Planctomycetota bacterium]|nr:toll/interleukin-1 receptor domain-containing protein [Planctomycetota bacterium]
MPLVFINYRRSDCHELATSIRLKLESWFGRDGVFQDDRAIKAGAKWPKEIQEKLEKADVVLVLIGTEWLKAQDEDGKRRLDQRADWVRKEIESALANEKTILPILVHP